MPSQIARTLAPGALATQLAIYPGYVRYRIAGAVVVLGQRRITDVPTLALALLAAPILWRLKRLPEPLIVLGAALQGYLLYPVTKGQ